MATEPRSFEMTGVAVHTLKLAALKRAAQRHQQRVDGERLRTRRTQLGLTQLGLAQQLGVHVNTVARMERGELRVMPRTWRQVDGLTSFGIRP
ncbi:helix-turn-helix domain-containing protein [Gemmatimonas sp. UBA7669]|uniref:helix-turn-helix domain-containing protein n=1 Tax=Gemmatimonas sp. UBA7669 TaxID=1946568 RepID=UPI0025C1A893|nr:helix-turn-helix transcriptional regulator [Gemmatimonas sp. UBA7669]